MSAAATASAQHVDPVTDPTAKKRPPRGAGRGGVANKKAASDTAEGDLSSSAVAEAPTPADPGNKQPQGKRNRKGDAAAAKEGESEPAEAAEDPKATANETSHKAGGAKMKANKQDSDATEGGTENGEKRGRGGGTGGRGGGGGRGMRSLNR